MNSVARGNAAEAAVMSGLVQLGAEVLIPFGGGGAYDLAVDLGRGILLRVQCKSARTRSGCAVFNTRSTDHGRGRESYLGRADIFGVHSAAEGSVYLIPVEECLGFEANLRLHPARNNQRKRVKNAADYSIERWSLKGLLTVAERARAPAA